MADVAVLALGLETGQMKSGGDQASRVLDDLQRKFEELERRSNALKDKLQGSGTTLKTASGQWREFGDETRGALGALSSLGGPIGTVAGKIENLTGQVGGLTSAFGLATGVALGFAAAVVAAGAGMATLALQGVKLSDEISDIGQSLGFSQSQMERFNAATRISGEGIGILERSFSQFEQAIKQGIEDPSSEAGRALQRLGIDLKRAATDPQAAYLQLLSTLDGVTGSIEQQTAANALFGRGTFALIRTAAEYREQLKLTDEQLIHMGLVASPAAAKAAADVDRAFGELSQTFDTFKRELVVPLSEAFIEMAQSMRDAFKDGADAAHGFARLVGEDLKNTARDIVLIIEALNDLERFSANTPEKRAANALADETRDALSGAFRAFQEGPFAPIRLQGRGGRAPGFGEPPPPTGPGVMPPLTSAQEQALRDIQTRLSRTTFTSRDRGGREPIISPAADEGDLQKALSKQRAFFESWRNIAAAFYDTQIFSFEQYTNEVTKREKEMRQQQLNDALFLQGQLEAQLARIPKGDTSSIARVTAELEKMRERVGELGLALSITTLPAIDKFTERLKDFRQLTLPLGRAPSISPTIPGVIDPGAAPSPGATRPRVVDQGGFERRAADRERINQEFSFVFEDFIFQIASGRKKLGQAFGDFALGMVDVFASEFARAFQQSLQKAFISPLTNWLEGALTEIFSGISGKGIGKFFGGLFKSVFSGFFAEGGTIPANHFGVVGERGPELAFAGSQPMTITPFGSGGGGNSVSVTFHVNAPGGSLDRRSMDQMSEQVLRAVERGTRNRGV